MNKKIISLFLAMLLLTGLLLPVSAQANTHVIDEAALLYSQEISALEEKVQELADQYGIDAVILTVDSLNGTSAQQFADDYYDSSGYGDDGVLFLLAMAEREWYISTCGNIIYALNDYGVQQLGEGAVSYFSQGFWYDGFDYFLSGLSTYLDAYENGRPVDGYADYSGDYYHGDRDEVIYYDQGSSPNFFISLVIGIAASAVVVLIMRYSMNTKRSQSGASAYMSDGSWNLRSHSDIFLYSNVTKTRRQQNTSSGGGSSMHRSSGGRRHGGGGGRF